MSLNLYRVSLECLLCAVRVFRNLIQHSPVCCLWVVNGFMETTFCFCFSVLKVFSFAHGITVASPRAELFIAPSTDPSAAGWQSCSLSPHTWRGTDEAAFLLTLSVLLTRDRKLWGSWWASKWSDPKWCPSLVVTIWPTFVTCPHPATRNQEKQSHHIPRWQRTGAICLIVPFQEWDI